MNILFKNIDIVTADSGKEVIKNGVVGIKNGYIEFVSEDERETSGFTAQKVIDGKNKLMMPGLINTHTHCAMTIMRNFADDLALHDWLFNHVFPVEAKLTSEDIYWGTMLGVAEMIKSGTTAFADMYLQMDAVAKAVTESGIRANLSISPLKFNVGEKGETVDETDKVQGFYKQWNNSCNGRIKVTLEVHSAYLFNKENLKNAAALAKQLGIGIQIHILETEKELCDSIQQYGKNSIGICLECGIFDSPTIAAHCVYLSEDDLRILKEKGVSVAHNPTSNLKLGSGIARIADMLDMGINVTIGTDGAASNNNLNMFEEMHLTALLPKGVKKNPQLISAQDTISMATANGAKALGFGKEVGVIKKGMKADLIILDMDKPHLCPVNNPVSAVVYSAQAADVDTMIVDGEILMENRELKTIDEELVKYKVKEIAKRVM